MVTKRPLITDFIKLSNGSLSYVVPQPRVLDSSFPVPSGKIATPGTSKKFSLSTSDSTLFFQNESKIYNSSSIC